MTNLVVSFLNWLIPTGSSAEEQARQQQQKEMMEELARREAQAERERKEEEARRLTEMYNRLASTLKLRGLPELQMKNRTSDGPGLHLKMRGDNDSQAGIQGLPGMYLKEGNENKGYGVSGLPGIYTNGPGESSGLTLKTRDSQNAAIQGAPPPAPVANFDPSKMTPQQLADVAEVVSKLSPEEQQRLMAMAKQQSSAGAPSQNGYTAEPSQPAPSQATGFGGTPQIDQQAPLTMKTRPNDQVVTHLQQQAAASQSAASAPALEDASAKARSGFDQPLGQQQLARITGTTPSQLRTPEPVVQSSHVEPPPPIAKADTSGMEQIKQYLFPATPAVDSTSRTVFPKDPNSPLQNPLRQEAKTQAELKAWDDWAIQHATNIHASSSDKPYPAATETAMLNAAAVKQYAPELLARYQSDQVFRQSVDSRLQYANEHIALDYYQAQADAHKAAILAFHDEMERLAATGRIERLTPLEDQFRRHPELHDVVQAVRDRISAREDAAVANAKANGEAKLEKEYHFVFQLIRSEAVQSR